jgi:hypothetical protein
LIILIVARRQAPGALGDDPAWESTGKDRPNVTG